ncbi:MAG: DUF4404 family protein [Cyanobacteria bacterium J06649_4]
MSKADIQQSIAALHTEIERLDTLDGAVKEKLLALISEVEEQMENPDGAPSDSTAVQSLPGLIEQFEADHPKVTENLGRLLNTLSSMGI